MFGWVIVMAALAYIGLLFLIARLADRRADLGRTIIANPYVYSLSLAVYCTAWTFYGSVGRAASSGIDFLPVYLGPTLMAGLWWVVFRKIIRISQQNSITSIADFVSSRYGKGLSIGIVVTGIAAVGIVPYVALQLDGVATSFSLLWHYPEVTVTSAGLTDAFGGTAFWVALLLGTFAILFGTRHLDVTEHHEGLVAAIAFESVVKLFAFLAVGIFVAGACCRVWRYLEGRRRCRHFVPASLRWRRRRVLELGVVDGALRPGHHVPSPGSSRWRLSEHG